MMTGAVPELEKTDFQSIRQWFAHVVDAIGGEGWHADDDVGDIISIRTGARLFTDKEADVVNEAMAKVFKAARDWPDFDHVYDLAMFGSFEIEKLYPGFVLDMHLSAGRLNYVTIPGRDLPNLLVEDMGQYAIVEFPERTGRLSEQGSFILKAVDRPASTRRIDPASIVVDEDTAIEFDDIRDLDDKIIELARSLSPRG